MAGIYIHIPFCHSKCAYCDFYSRPGVEGSEAFVDALLREFDARRAELSSPVETIYIGGGTPSSLPVALLDRIIARLPLADVKEFTIEVNPEDVTPEFARWLQQSPVERVSMGIQSFNDDILRFVGRRHSARQAADALYRLRSAGCDVSLDLIYGLPHQDFTDWADSLRQALDFRPEHLSCYALSYEPGTRLTAMVSAGKLTPTPDDDIIRMYNHLCAETARAGYDHYEISNFSLPGHRARHNSSYWSLVPYLGLGPGAHSFTGGVRSQNPANLKRYLATRGVGINEPEQESDAERYNDYIMIRLRTAEGLSLSAIRTLFGDRLHEYTSSIASRLLSTALLTPTSPSPAPADSFRIPESQWLIADSIISEFILIPD